MNGGKKNLNYKMLVLLLGIILTTMVFSGCVEENGEETEGLEIVVVGRDSASGTREYFWEAVLDEEEFVDTTLEKNSNGAVHQTVSQTPGAIGFVGLGYIDDDIKALYINGIEPTVANVQSGEYPIARHLNMFTNGEPTRLPAEFLAFIDSDDGQEIVEDEGFVPKDGTGTYSINESINFGTLTITGSTTVLPIATAAAEEFETLYPNVQVTVSGGGSSVGVQSAGEGTADIGMASRELKSTEKTQYPDLIQHIVCDDGIALIVHPTNDYVDVFQIAEVIDIYTGEYTDWSELVPESVEIVVVGRDSASGTREYFWEAVLDEEDFVDTTLEKNSNGAVHQTVSQTPGAIGFVGLGYIDNDVKAIYINGVEPTIANVQSGQYPIARHLNMFTDGEPTGLAAEFLTFIDSDDGQAIVADEGFVSKDGTGAYSVNPGITSGTLTITGSTTVLPVATAAAEEFETLYSGVEVTVSGGGSSVGVQSAGEGTADIGMASRELKDTEKTQYPDLVQHIVCDDGIALILHPSNDHVMDLTVNQVKNIYTGEYTDWNEF